MRIIRQPSDARTYSDERTYSIVTGSGSRYRVRDFELKRWLLNLGVGESAIVAALDTEPNGAVTIQMDEAA